MIWFFEHQKFLLCSPSLALSLPPSVSFSLTQSRQTPEGEFLPLDQLELDVGFSTGADQLFLVSPLTICHVIDSKSPFYDLSLRSMQTEQFEIVVILEGIVETTGETVVRNPLYGSYEGMQICFCPLGNMDDNLLAS